MAIFYLDIRILSRGRGHSVVCAAAYIRRDKIRDLFLGYEYDFTHKGGLVHDEILLPRYGKERVERVVASIVTNAPEKKFSKRDREWATKDGQHSRFFIHSDIEYNLLEKFVQPFRDTLSRMKKIRDTKDNSDKWIFRDKDEPSPTTPKKINPIHKPPPQRKKQITRTRNDNNALDV